MCPTLCDPMNLSKPGLSVHHQLLEFTQTHAHRVSDAIQPSHPLLSPSPPAPNPCQKCKSKLWWGITSPQSEWPSSKIYKKLMLERIEEKGPLLHCQWDCTLMQPLWTVWRFFKKKQLWIKSPYDPAVPLLGIGSVVQSCPILCDPMNHSTPGLPLHHQFPEFTQTCVHWVADAIQPSHPLLSPSPAFNLSQHQGFFKWVNSLHQVAKVLKFQLHQSFQWTFRTDFL